MTRGQGIYEATQVAIMEALDARHIPYLALCTGGNCSAVAVRGEQGVEAVCTNLEAAILVLDPNPPKVDGYESEDTGATLFCTNEEVPARVRLYVEYGVDNEYDRADEEIVRDFLAVVGFITATDGDPYEHRMSDGSAVVDVLTP